MPTSTEQARGRPRQSPQANWQPPPKSPELLSVEKSGRHALGWSLAGFFLCCFPLSIIGIALAFRSRKLAARHALVAPASSTVAMVLSGVALALTVMFSIWFAYDQHNLSKRIEELNARIPKHDAEEQLQQQTACDLAELRVRNDGWKDDSAIVIDGFDCPGVVMQKGAEAELPDFSFNTSSEHRVTVTVCYKRGVRWTVKSFREAGGCFDQAATDPPQPE